MEQLSFVNDLVYLLTLRLHLSPPALTISILSEFVETFTSLPR
jgi:hypothetical protein